MDFKDVLDKGGIDIDRVMVMRHRPSEPKLRKIMPWLAADRPEIFNAYQQTQNPDAEKALTKADFVAAFIGIGDKAVFVGLYQRGESRLLTDAQFWAIPAVQELEPFGLRRVVGQDTLRWFDLELLDFCAEWKGRLVVKWPQGRLWWRWAKSNDFTIRAIHEESLFDEAMPPWDQLSLSHNDLKVLPTRHADALKEWRGIYFIIDASDGKGYVGSAGGRENLLGRWREYGASGHGGNKKLKQRDPRNFIFTILQRTSPDMDPAEIVRLENSWKERLHTREFGLNEN
jgi:hypothetical protein